VKRHVVFYTTVFLLALSATHGPSWATWSSGHAICEDSGSAVWKESGIMMKRTMSCPGLGRREGGCGVEN